MRRKASSSQIQNLSCADKSSNCTVLVYQLLCSCQDIVTWSSEDSVIFSLVSSTQTPWIAAGVVGAVSATEAAEVVDEEASRIEEAGAVGAVVGVVSRIDVLQGFASRPRYLSERLTC